MGKNATVSVATSQVLVMNSVGPETIAVAKGPAGLRQAVMERLGEKANMSVLPNQQVSPSPATTDIVSKLI